MTAFLIVIACVVALVVIVAAYWKWMLATYTDPGRADEVHMVTTKDLWRIRLCRYKPEGGGGEPVFLCHGFMSNQFNFSNPPDESMVDVLVGRGYDVWAIDLRGSRSSIPPFGRTLEEPTLDDYLLHDIPTAIEYIGKHTGYAKVHWIGHSMGGMLLYAYEAAFGAGRLASGTTLGSPVGFEGFEFSRPALLLALRRSSRLLWDVLVRGLLPLFYVIKPQSRYMPINWDNMSPAIGVGVGFNAIEIPPPEVAEALSNAAENKVWRVKDDEIDVLAAIKKLRVPLFAIFGQADPFVPVATVGQFFKALPGSDKKLLILSKENGHAADYSHVDLVFGRDCVEEVFEPIVQWLQAHPINQRLRAKKAGVKAAAKKKATPKKKAAPAKKKAAAKKPAAKKKAPTAKKSGAAKKSAAKKPAAKKKG